MSFIVTTMSMQYLTMSYHCQCIVIQCHTNVKAMYNSLSNVNVLSNHVIAMSNNVMSICMQNQQCHTNIKTMSYKCQCHLIQMAMPNHTMSMEPLTISHQCNASSNNVMSMKCQKQNTNINSISYNVIPNLMQCQIM